MNVISSCHCCRMTAERSLPSFAELTRQMDAAFPPDAMTSVCSCSCSSTSTSGSYLEHIPHIDIDHNNTYEVWLWEKLKNRSLGEWIELYSHRTAGKTPYGDKPYNRNSGSKRREAKQDRRSEAQRLKDEEHRVKECERRERDRLWRRMLDLWTGDFCSDLALEHLAEAKEKIGHRALDNEAQKIAEPGKDQQMLSDILSTIMSRWIIQVQTTLLSTSISDYRPPTRGNSRTPSPRRQHKLAVRGNNVLRSRL